MTPVKFIGVFFFAIAEIISNLQLLNTNPYEFTNNIIQ